LPKICVIFYKTKFTLKTDCFTIIISSFEWLNLFINVLMVNNEHSFLKTINALIYLELCSKELQKWAEIYSNWSIESFPTVLICQLWRIYIEHNFSSFMSFHPLSITLCSSFQLKQIVRYIQQRKSHSFKSVRAT